MTAFAGMTLALGLAGCALPDLRDIRPFTAPSIKTAPAVDALPTGYSTSTGAFIDVPQSPWWQVFRDPKLNAAVTEAVGENPQVFQAQARAAQARAQAVIAGAERLPAIGAGFDAAARRQNTPPLGFQTNESYGLNLAVNWEIDLWGRIAAQQEAAREGYLASVEGLRAVRQSIAANTAKVYFAVVEARQQSDVSQQVLDILTETARQVGNRSDVGVGAPSDKFLAIANRDSAIAQLAGNEETVKRTTRQLELLLRDYPSGTVDTARTLAAVPPLPGAGLPAGLLARRPDVLAAERQLRASGFQVASAERSLLPAISLSGGIGSASAELGDLLDGDFSFWQLAGNLLQPVFQGGRLRANVRLNEAAQQEAAEAYVEVVLQALSEVETALDAHGEILKRITALCSAAEAAKSAERISFNRYRQGVEPFLTVLESQSRSLNVRASCITAQRAGLDNYIDLSLALGGGFETTAAALPTAGTVFIDRFVPQPEVIQ